MRKLNALGWKMLVNLLFGYTARDVDCAFKLLRRETLEKITIECDNFFVCTELLAKARKWNFRIGEKGVRHYPRTAGETTVQVSDVPRTLREVFRMWRRIYFPSRKHLRGMMRKQGADSNVVEYIP